MMYNGTLQQLMDLSRNINGAINQGEVLIARKEAHQLAGFLDLYCRRYEENESDSEV